MRIYKQRFNKLPFIKRKRRKRLFMLDQIPTPQQTVQIGRNADRMISWEPRAVYWDEQFDTVAMGRSFGMSDSDFDMFRSFWGKFDPEGKLEGRIARDDFRKLGSLEFDRAFEAFIARLKLLDYILADFREKKQQSKFADSASYNGWLAQVVVQSCLRAKQRLELDRPFTPELQAKWDETMPVVLKLAGAQLNDSEYRLKLAKGLYYADMVAAGAGITALGALAFIYAGPAVAAFLSTRLGTALASAIVGGTVAAAGSVVTQAVKTAGEVAQTGLKTTGELITGAGLALGSIGNTSMQYMPAGFSTAFENRNIPNVIELAFADAQLPYDEYKAHRRRSRDAANRAYKLIKAHNPGVGSAIASFGGMSIIQSDRLGTHDLNDDAMLMARLMDYAQFEDVFDIEPGSHEAYMCADMFDLEAYKDPHTHYFLKKLWKGVKSIGKKLLPFAAFIPGIGTAIAGLGSGLISSAVGVAQKLGLGQLASAAGSIAETVWQQKVREGVAGTERAIQEGASQQTVGRPVGAFTVVPGGRMIVHPLTNDPSLAARAEAVLTEFLLNAELVDQAGGFSTKLRPPAAAYAGVAGMPAGVFTMAPNGGINVLPTVGSRLPGAQLRAQQMLAQFTGNRQLQGGAFTVGGFQGVANLATYADGATVGLGSTRSPALVPYLSDRPAFLDGQTSNDVPCGHLFDRPGVPLPQGEFYRSGMLVARLSDLPSGVYGQIRVGELPYTIDINRNSVDSRAKVSFVHETLHGITELLKLGLSHDQLHALSVFITSEVLPGYLALSNKTK